MPYIKVKQKYQVTLPSNIREAIGIHEGDTLEARAENGNIVLVPQLVQEKKPAAKKKIDISKYVGCMTGVYGSTPQEVEEYIRQQRNSWD